MTSRRGRFEGSIRQRGETWEGRVTVGWDPAGRPIRKNVYAKTRTDCVKAMNKIAAQPAATANPEKNTVSDLLDLWLGSLAADGSLRPSSLAYYTSAAKNVRKFLGRIRLSKLNPIGIQEALKHITAAATRAAAHTTIKVALKYAVSVGLLSSVPMTNVKRPRVERKEKIRIWSQDEARKVLAAAAETDWSAVYALGLGAGLRRGEIFALRWRDVDLDGGSVRVERSLSEVAGKFTIELPKTKSSARTVAVHPFVIDALRGRMPENADPEALIFESREGKPGQPRFVRRSNFDRRVHRQIVEAAGVPYRTMHELRHSHASMLLSAGQSLTIVAERLGHADPAVTLRVYSHLLPRAQAAAALAIGDMLTPAKAPKTRKPVKR